MLAAALTLWVMFAVWLAGPALGVPRGVARTAAGLLVLELATLLAWSYGCEATGCGALAEAAGAAARIDVPALAAVFVALVAGAGWTRGRRRRRVS